MRAILHNQITSLGTARGLGYGLSKAASAAVNARGSGYRLGDTLTVGGTWLAACTLRVDAVDGLGGVVSVTVLTPGCVVSGSKPSAPTATTVSPAGGTGCTVTVTYTDDAIPDGVGRIDFQAESQTVRWRDDGTAPTSTTGFTLAVGSTKSYEGASLGSVKVIEATSGAKLNVTMYAL